MKIDLCCYGVCEDAAAYQQLSVSAFTIFSWCSSCAILAGMGLCWRDQQNLDCTVQHACTTCAHVQIINVRHHAENCHCHCVVLIVWLGQLNVSL